MEMSEFLERAASEAANEELDVQKAVVESLAADKAEQDERIGALQAENERLQAVQGRLQAENSQLQGTIAGLE